MEPHERAMLEESLSLARENNEMLRSLRSNMRWTRLWRAIYWLVILGSLVGAYYYVQPYLDPMFQAYNKALEVSAELGKIGDQKDQFINSFLNQPVTTKTTK